MTFENMIIEGTELVYVDGVRIPVNQDFMTRVGQIAAYDASIAKVTLTAVWQKSGTLRNFFAWAKYQGKAGIPTTDEVVIGEYIGFLRTGNGNNNFSILQTAFQLYDDASTTKASFVAFFPKIEAP